MGDFQQNVKKYSAAPLTTAVAKNKKSCMNSINLCEILEIMLEQMGYCDEHEHTHSMGET